MASYSNLEKESLKKAEERSKGYSDKATGLSDAVKAEIQKNINAAAAQMQSENKKATAQTNSDYNRLINIADIDRIAREKAIEQAIGNQPLNSTQQISLNLAQGNAQYSANAQRDAAVQALANILSGYRSQSKANQLTSNAGFDNSISSGIASNRAANNQNALSNAASMYSSSTEAETAAANAQAKAQMQAMQDTYSTQKAAQDKYYSNIDKLIKAGRTYEDAVALTNGQEPQSEIMARQQANQEAEAQARQERILGPEKPNFIDTFMADYGNNSAKQKVERYNEWDSKQLKPTLNSAEIAKTGAWVDPDKTVRQYADVVRQSVNAGDVDMDTAVKKIISLYGLKDNPDVQQFEFQGKTIYAPGDEFRNAQIGFAIDMAGLRPYVDANRSKYYNERVGNGSWILQ